MHTKFSQLRYLKPILYYFDIPDIISINAELFKKDKITPYEEIQSVFKERSVAIRSSAADEDGESNSLAGEYESVLNVSSNDLVKVISAIDAVILSYERKRPLLAGDEIIVQKMLQKISMSGVIFTHDFNTGAPYYVVNYDDKSGLTDTVTSGDGEHSNRTIYIHRNSVKKLRSERFKILLQAVQELECVMESQFLDIEFALGEDLTPYLLQVRAITTCIKWNKIVSSQIDDTLEDVQSFVSKRLKRVDDIYGRNTVLGQMPDWNPIEMIGRVPHALAASLYRTLITNDTWSVSRSIMGYKSLYNQPLMLMLAGQPFIDTRLSFHSYLPKSIPSKTSEKLVNHWVDKLKDSPELHDKVEFEVAITSYSFDFDKKMNKLIGGVLTNSEKEEFKKAHLEHTKELIKGYGAGSANKALDKINLLSSKYKDFKGAKNILYLTSMIDDCINLGTVPFAILARHGFIAKTILLSLESIGVLTKSEVNQIQSSVRTVASEMIDDMKYFQLGKMSEIDFMDKYGHLRPGTYDIMSHRYDQIDSLLDNKIPINIEQHDDLFELSKKHKHSIDKILEENDFKEFKSIDLIDYVNKAIIGREYGKFIFTRVVSEVLELIANFAKLNGLTRDEISHVPLESILDMTKISGKSNIKDQLKEISKKEKEKHNISIAIRLPQLLSDVNDVHIVPFQISHPNFITQNKITAKPVVLNSKITEVLVTGKIILIEGADPGFDWIFSKNIAGLITKYGGANSHMAIRCSEFGIPAAIGCGEQKFNAILKAGQLHLDCAAGLISTLH